MGHAVQPPSRILDAFSLHQGQKETKESLLNRILCERIIARQAMGIPQQRARMQLVGPDCFFSCAAGIHRIFWQRSYGQRSYSNSRAFVHRLDNTNKKASAAFAAFSPSCKREYVKWIAEAKRAETREKRIATAIDWISEGKQRNWKYQNCRWQSARLYSPYAAFLPDTSE
jgi:hypothetical protein